jgi:hypothetical protein
VTVDDREATLHILYYVLSYQYFIVKSLKAFSALTADSLSIQKKEEMRRLICVKEPINQFVP